MSSPTPEQAAAIAAEGDVLVMAGAGTGKTRTLVERLVERLTRPVDPLSLDRVLMVTFTEAAAAEMRGRLRERLVRRVAEAPDDVHLARQLLLLDTADIGTLHGFCLRLIRGHFHELELDPQLEVLDDAAARRMSADTLAAVLRPLYGGGDALGAAVRELAQVQFDGDVDRLEQTILALHARLRSLADPDGWLRRARAVWEEGGAAMQRSALVEALGGWAAGWVDRLTPLAPDNPKAAELLPRLTALAAGTGEPGAVLEALAGADASWPKKMKTRLREPLKGFFDDVAALRSWWDIPVDGPDPVLEDWQWCRPRMHALLEVLHRFSSEYARRKRAAGRLDFSDLEQFALDLLGHRPGAASATPAAAACRSQYDLVLVDEAQDVNEAQDAILRAVARPAPDGNRFLVGDVKQSIYRFRFAEPRLFQDYARDWGTSGGPGRVLPLTGNFRSAESLLGFVNDLFHAIQRPEAGGVAYDAEARLRFGAPEQRAALSAAADPAPRVEVHLQLPAAAAEDGDPAPGGGEDAEEVSALQAEARRVALELRRLRDGGFRVWDAALGGFRPVGWGDMAVLLRAERTRIADFAAAFRTVGVPLVARQGDFFTRLEVSDLHAVLRLVDNPLQDIPVLTALRSPLVGMSDVNELAAVRMFARREKPWWTLLQRFHRAGRELCAAHPGLADGEPCPCPAEPPPLTDADGRPVLEGADVFLHPATALPAARAWVRVDRFLGWHAAWRQLGRQGSMRALLEAVLDDTGYEARLAGNSGGADALANVRQLLEVARRFDRSQRGGVYRFLSHLDDLHAADALEAGAGAAAGDAVQLLTIHRSKGLEFPVVAVANLGSRFHLGDLHAARVLFDERRGLCPRVVTPRGQDYPSLPLWLARRDEMRERLGEEIRLLYVAFTRARDRLLLFGTTRRADPSEAWAPVAGAARAAGGAGGARLPVHDLLGAADPLGWLGPALGALSEPDWASRPSGRSERFTWQVHSTPPEVAAVVPLPESGPADAGESVDPGWRYPHEPATREPAKTTVTALRRRASLEDPDDATPFPGSAGGTAGRRGGGAGNRSAAERGTLHHRFLEHVDPAACGSADGVGSERDRLVREGHLRADEAAALDLPALVRFWESPLGVRAREAAAAGSLRREFPFTVRLDGADLRSVGITADGLADGEFVVAQGVIDLAGEDADGLWILDFKTDAVSPGASTAERAAAYRPQLRAYALALGRILGRPVTGCWLHFLATGASVQVG